MRKIFLIPGLVLISCVTYDVLSATSTLPDRSQQAPNYVQLALFAAAPLQMTPTYLPLKTEKEPKVSVSHKKASPKLTVHEPESYEVINKYFQKGKVAYAKKLALEYLVKYPNDGDVRLVLGQIYLQEKEYQKADDEFSWIIKYYPKYADARISLADVYQAFGWDDLAMNIIDEGLEVDPNNPYLLNKKAQIFLGQYQYAVAASIAQRAIAENPNNKDGIAAAEDTLSTIKETSPRYTYGRNEAGISSQNDFVTDVHQIWDLSTVYVARDTIYGRVAAAINVASRFNRGTPQGELDFSPVINKYVYFDLVVAGAQQPILFPDYLVGGEAHLSMPKFVDLSAAPNIQALAIPIWRLTQARFLNI